jgi:hypothetical protein
LLQVPLFVPDTATDAAAFIKKATDFAMGSWWLGGTHYVANTNFMAEVEWGEAGRFHGALWEACGLS